MVKSELVRLIDALCLAVALIQGDVLDVAGVLPDTAHLQFCDAESLCSVLLSFIRYADGCGRTPLCLDDRHPIGALHF